MTANTDVLTAATEAVDEATLACYNYVLSSEERDTIAQYAVVAVEPMIRADERLRIRGLLRGMGYDRLARIVEELT